MRYSQKSLRDTTNALLRRVERKQQESKENKDKVLNDLKLLPLQPESVKANIFKDVLGENTIEKTHTKLWLYNRRKGR